MIYFSTNDEFRIYTNSLVFARYFTIVSQFLSTNKLLRGIEESFVYIYIYNSNLTSNHLTFRGTSRNTIEPRIVGESRVR